ncbi:MAG: hypothetical protein DLM66_14815 [Candidatus Dormiibacter spiritus]|nr:MAG: hypothetical protein DLM66_14815 [Candidatus Dormibacteraeota bacterium]
MAFEILQTVVPAIAAAAGTTVEPIGEVPVREAEGAFNVERVVVTTPTTVTGAATNTGTINIRQMRAGSAVATLASLALLAGTNLTAEIPAVLALTGVPTVVAGDLLEFQYVQIGTGLALPAGVKVGVELD